MAAELGPCSPFLIVADIPRSLAFYVDQLGFDLRYAAPEEVPFFAIVGRGSAQIMLKNVGEPPLPNSLCHADARWDVFFFTPDPDTLSQDFSARNVVCRAPLADTEEGLRGFEIADPDGYVCFFGCPKLAEKSSG